MNKLALNVLKTEFMIIGTSQRLNILDQTPETTPYIISVDGCQIRRVKSVNPNLYGVFWLPILYGGGKKAPQSNSGI